MTKPTLCAPVTMATAELDHNRMILCIGHDGMASLKSVHGFIWQRNASNV